MKAKFIVLASIFAPFAASAQVIINQAALDQLAGIPPVVITAPPEIRQPPRKVTYRPVYRRHVAAPKIASAGVVAKPPVAPKPVAPPAQLAVARPVVPKPVAPPPVAKISFAAGAADLPAGIAAQIKPFCAKPAPGFITIDAYAAADPSDPSAAPRLSLARAFALRDALVACGVPSASIIPRADGVGKNPDVAQISASP